jgi:hypothetical protein
MNSVDNVLFVYRFERCEREAFQLVLSLLNNPQTKVTIVMPSRRSWERELMRQYHQDDGDEFSDDYDDDDATEMDELMELAVSDDDIDVDLGEKDVKAALGDEADKPTNEDEDEEMSETKTTKKRKAKKDKCCPYSVGDFFDILFLLGLLKRGLVRLMHALLDKCCGGGQRRQQRSSLDDSSPSSSAEDIGMQVMASTAKKGRRASVEQPSRSDRPAGGSDSDSEMTPAATGSGLTTSRSVQGISRYRYATLMHTRTHTLMRSSRAGWRRGWKRRSEGAAARTRRRRARAITRA